MTANGADAPAASIHHDPHCHSSSTAVRIAIIGRPSDRVRRLLGG